MDKLDLMICANLCKASYREGWANGFSIAMIIAAIVVFILGRILA